MPFIFSYSRYNGFRIGSIEFSRLELSVKNFIRESIPSNLIFLSESNFREIVAEIGS
jgi:hypothetical protein